MKASPNSRWDWQAAILLLAAVFVAAARLDTTSWTPDLGYVELLAILGVILGLALGYSRFQRRALAWIVSGYTLVIVPAQLCWTITGEKTAIGQLASLGGRLAASFALLFSGKPIQDHLFFVALMAFLFWAIGIYSGQRLVRQPSILPVLLPSTLPILIIQYYDGFKPDRIWGLAVYFFLALLLTGRMNLLNARQRWEEQNIVAGSDPEFDLNKYILIATAVIILTAWMLPAPAAVLPSAVSAWKSINRPFDGARRRINDMLAALQSGTNPNTAVELYGAAMGLGHDAGNGVNELFSVSVPQNTLPRLYWRMRTYDTYQNGTWQSSGSLSIPFDPVEGNLTRTDSSMAGAVGEFVFSWQASRSSLLATPSLPVWVSRTGSLQTSTQNDMQLIDPLSWSVAPNILTGDQYRVRALLLNPTVKELRSAGSEYPQWVKDHYLQIPAGISADFGKLAAQITSGQTTAFDKADAVTAYLRQNIRYSETIPAPPPGVEPLNWFLFIWKSGFCNYYASAEVLLLRSQGIPARMVVGYSQGKIGSAGTYTVRGENAHAWPEVYFPNIGWVEFEPTVTQDALVRPSGEPVTPGANTGVQQHALIDGLTASQRARLEEQDAAIRARSNQNKFMGVARETWLWIIISVLVVTGSVFWGWKLQKRQSFAQRAPLAVQAIYNHYHLKNPAWLENWVLWNEVSPMERAFHAINQSLVWLRKPQPVHATPAERARILKGLVPDASQEIDNLSAALEQSIYSAHPGDPANAARMGWKIRLITLRAILLSRFHTR